MMMMRTTYSSLILVSAIFVGCAGLGQKPVAKSGTSVAASPTAEATGEDLFDSFFPRLVPLATDPAVSNRFDFKFADVVVCRIAPPQPTRPLLGIDQPVGRGHPEMSLIDDTNPGNGN
jgi:hypothetical protein